MITGKLKIILSQRKYALLAVATFVISFVAYYLLTLMYTYKFSLQLFVQMNGLGFTVASFALNAVISVLLGLNVAVFAHNLAARLSARKEGSASGLGVFAGMAGAGCPMCGALVASLIGVPVGLGLLPFKGLELKALSTFILLGALYLGTRRANKCKGCTTRK